MAAPDQIDERNFSYPELQGLDERHRATQTKEPTFDDSFGFIQQSAGVLQRINGIKPLLNIPGKTILNICQTFDSRGNVLIQTDQGLYLASEDEVVGRAVVTNLSPVVLLESESMSKAILVHAPAAGANGGTLSPADTWVDAPLLTILSQLNPDGTAAAFVTALAGNIFTLAAGSYRFSGKSAMSDVTANIRLVARLFNVTTGLPAWSGLQNEDGNTVTVDTTARNYWSHFGGDLTIAVPTQFKIQGKSSGAENNTGFGAPMSGAGYVLAHELYRWLEIFKTA